MGDLNLKEVLVFIDLIILSDTPEEHERRLMQVQTLVSTTIPKHCLVNGLSLYYSYRLTEFLVISELAGSFRSTI